MNKFNDWLALRITKLVGTMYAAYVFTLIAFDGLPQAIKNHQIIPWISSNFLQLVLLPIIMVGQNLQSKKTDDLHQAVKKVHKHLGIKK